MTGELPDRIRAARDRWVAARRERRALDLVKSLRGRVSFIDWERAGFHLLPVHYYSPIPDTARLPRSLWDVPNTVAGLDFRDVEERKLLRDLTRAYGEEFNAFPRERQADGGFHVFNGFFESVDAEIWYAMIRKHKPSRIVEIGSGWSTLVALRALDANAREERPAEILAIEPYPSDVLLAAITDRPEVKLAQTPVQRVGLDTFTSLRKNDILFIDSSHVGRIGSDVLYEIHEILPRLAKGVLVHIHDIFLPAEYPKDWVFTQHRFWNEQYLVRAFLAMNSGYEIVWGGSYMHLRHSALLERCIDSYDPVKVWPGSLWVRRV